MIVMDASAAINIARHTAEGRALESLTLPEERVDSIPFFRAEILNTCWKLAAKTAMTADEAKELRNSSLALIDQYHVMDDLEKEVLHEAVRLDHPVYDIFYLVLARRMDATLFTLDKRLRALAEQMGVDCVHLVDC